MINKTKLFSFAAILLNMLLGSFNKLFASDDQWFINKQADPTSIEVTLGRRDSTTNFRAVLTPKDENLVRLFSLDVAQKIYPASRLKYQPVAFATFKRAQALQALKDLLHNSPIQIPWDQEKKRLWCGLEQTKTVGRSIDNEAIPLFSIPKPKADVAETKRLHASDSQENCKSEEPSSRTLKPKVELDLNTASVSLKLAKTAAESFFVKQNKTI